ncbi:hypothetical protein DICSQDRAFT_163884 [Dichomitus squalens LYAD-421 SS1]|uniref:F-box domain-containing protein n=1 Tax=Dichomitus squalens (strain LYAD-421) TaxID=732165 RepID=R7SKT5_DICSQ|nr:uncharacterized protein DICSQDRAFT_163884 [Dichomitus squalens LYAD-421 SS1]EJF56483.1 hypothetical protein DICSQDRAFT_163884 [Dichomitus squalens LYAD-421 SS1]
MSLGVQQVLGDANIQEEGLPGDFSTQDMMCDGEGEDAKDRWNPELPIMQFPDEIILPIFFYFSEAAEPAHSCENTPFRDWAGNLRWTQLMLVCRRWCNIACTTPTLWRTIDMRDKISKWSELALIRSLPATIDISFPSGPITEDHLSILEPHWHRLRSLCLRHWTSCALSIFRSDLPSMEYLQISGFSRDSLGPEKGEIPDLVIKSTNFPNLVVLSITRVVAPTDPSVYSRLRKLALDRCPCNLSLAMFIQLLADGPRLELLDLRHFLHHLSHDGADVKPREPPKLLPSLDVLNLEDHPPSSSSLFLSRVALPPQASVRINSIIGQGQDETTISLTTLMPPDRTDSLPLLSTLTHAMVNVGFEGYSITDRPLERSLAKVHLELVAPIMAPWGGRMEHGLNDLISVFAPAAATLTHLQIGGRCDTRRTETWVAVFRTFPAPTYLEAGTDEVVFAGGSRGLGGRMS